MTQDFENTPDGNIYKTPSALNFPQKGDEFEGLEEEILEIEETDETAVGKPVKIFGKMYNYIHPDNLSAQARARLRRYARREDGLTETINKQNAQSVEDSLKQVLRDIVLALPEEVLNKLKYEQKTRIADDFYAYREKKNRKQVVDQKVAS